MTRRPFGTRLVRHKTATCHLQSDQHHLCAKELSSVALGGKVVSVSDEFFAEAFHLILVEVSSYAMTPYVLLSAHLQSLEGPAKPERTIRAERRSLQWLGNSETQS